MHFFGFFKFIFEIIGFFLIHFFNTFSINEFLCNELLNFFFSFLFFLFLFLTSLGGSIRFRRREGHPPVGQEEGLPQLHLLLRGEERGVFQGAAAEAPPAGVLHGPIHAHLRSGESEHEDADLQTR